MTDTFKGGKPRFTFLSGDVNYSDYGGKWISQQFNNGEFNWWFVIELTNLLDSCGERQAKEMGGKYAVELSVVSIDQAGDELYKAGESWGMEKEDVDITDDKNKVEILHSYGTRAMIWQKIGPNYLQLLKEAKQQARVDEFFFGFAMDRPVNAIGTTGWEMLKGDLLAPLRRPPTDDETAEKQLMRKLTPTN